MRYCKTPCPGCGETGKYRKSSEVCRDCRTAIKEHDTLTKALYSRRNKQTEMVGVPENSHWLPYLHHGGEFRTEFHKFILSISLEGTGRDGWINESLLNGQNGVGKERMFLKGHPQAIRDLYTAIEQALQNAYAKGRESGADILNRLMSGEIKNEEINEQVLKDKA